MDGCQLDETTDDSVSVGDSTPSGPPQDPAACTVDATSSSPSIARHSPLLDQCLQFLSAANNATLAALGGVTIAITYFVLGRLSLVLFGVVAGIGLHSSWEGYKEYGDESTKAGPSIRRRELGIEVAKRLLNWEESRTTDKPRYQASPEDMSMTKLDYSDFQPATAAALNTLTDAVIRDYVQWWYQPILSSEQTFPQSCRSTLARFVISISSHLSRKRPADIFLHFVTNASSIIIVFLNELSSALQSTSSGPASTADAISTYLNRFPESNLANVLSTTQQRAKLRLVASDLLQTFLQPDLYDCEPVRVFLCEILSGVILESVIDNCSKPEWINGWIVQLLEEGEPELMSAIDIGVDGARQNNLEEFSTHSLAANNNMPDFADDSRTSQQNQGLTKAQIEMEEAVREAKRLSAMIESGSTRGYQEQPSTIVTDGDIDIRHASFSSKISHVETTASSDGVWIGNVTTRHGDVSRSSNELGDSRNSMDEPRSIQEASIRMILLGASVSIFDDNSSNDKGAMRVKPTDDYLLQIEPASSRHPGWVITRKYADFEVLHEVLRRISVVSGVSDFVEQHRELPTWKGQYQSDLRQSLERYLQHALRFERLAGCEAMKRFLEKERSVATSSPNGIGKSGFSFPSQAVFENMGKGVLEVLSSAPKGVAGGGKAVLEGVTGVFGAGSSVKKRSVDFALRDKVDPKLRMPPNGFFNNKVAISQNSGGTAEMASPSRPDTEHYIPLGSGSIENAFEKPLTYVTHEDAEENEEEQSVFKRPVADRLSPSLSPEHSGQNQENGPVASKNRLQEVEPISTGLAGQVTGFNGNTAVQPESDVESLNSHLNPDSTEVRVMPLSEEETGVAVELLFAVINELYALSSAWGIRKKLLNAARSFLLRPGNPNIEGIRLLMQQSIIESNASDDALATYITALRQNALPTEDELKSIHPPLTDDEQMELRIKARKLLVTRGMPRALTSIMGNAATTEALGHVFDSLQVKSVARGFIFAFLLQALKAMIQ
ncbi:PX domain-containing protein [Histoplasma capsulatum var. duboisii H88]|uniref:PX domain-containing protein n=2 Tax=Ajellomyces capsulatus TaxID=5037 RepID=F0U4M4_AJEC8|nr:PX domain-containing protein [Histoplasma capsulatum H143]EGC41971.1 PX domain-containing protein [Histoplasma capsulatum var. duboisii H88]QSS51603.1 PX domain-containing protein [Histoplasma capsulatum var. duboisii H88]